jgi:arylsulfatase
MGAKSRQRFDSLGCWTGKTEKSARREFFLGRDRPDGGAASMLGKMHIGVKHQGSWFDENAYPSVPYVVNLLMDPMEKMTPDSEEWGYVGKKFVAEKLWAPTAAGPFLAAHLKSLQRLPAESGRRHAEHEEGGRGDDEQAR